MIAISLWQPWASAIAVGLKSIETRSWPAHSSVVGRQIAIHAAKRNTPEQRAWWIEHVAHNGEHSSAFARFGLREWEELPFGMIVATAKLAAVVSTNSDPTTIGLHPLNTDEAWGNFSIDRYAWFLHDIAPLATPVPWVGRQGFFEWTPNPLRQTTAWKPEVSK